MEKDKEVERYGYFFARGIGKYLYEAFKCWVKAVAIFIVLALVYGIVIQKTDDSDISRWNRSGLKIYTDAKTGVEYLSTRGGALTPRIQK